MVVLTAAGCKPAASSKDMGTIVHEIPRVPGADKPYELPKIIIPHKEDANSSLDDENSVESNRQEPEKTSNSSQTTPNNTQSPKPTPARRQP